MVRRPGVVPPARRRDEPAHPGGRQRARHPDPRRRNLPAAAARPALAATHGRFDRTGDRTQAPAARGRWAAVVLRAVQRKSLRRVLPPQRHRAGLPAGVRTLLFLARTPHLQGLRTLESRALEVRHAGHLMLKIDTHAHYLPRDWPDLAAKYGDVRFPV